MVTKHFIHIGVHYTTYVAIFFVQERYARSSKKPVAEIEMARARPLRNATERMDHTLVSIHILLPPARCPEIQTLELAHETLETPFQPLKKQKNLMVVSSFEKSITLVFHNYKTAKFRGKDITEIKV